MLRYMKNDHFVSRMEKILTFFHDWESKMGNPLISRTGNIPTDYLRRFVWIWFKAIFETEVRLYHGGQFYFQRP